MITASWLHSPDTFAVSPHLAWLNRVFLENGGHVRAARASRHRFRRPAPQPGAAAGVRRGHVQADGSARHLAARRDAGLGPGPRGTAGGSPGAGARAGHAGGAGIEPAAPGQSPGHRQPASVAAPRRTFRGRRASSARRSRTRSCRRPRMRCWRSCAGRTDAERAALAQWIDDAAAIDCRLATSRPWPMATAGRDVDAAERWSDFFDRFPSQDPFLMAQRARALSRAGSGTRRRGSCGRARDAAVVHVLRAHAAADRRDRGARAGGRAAGADCRPRQLDHESADPDSASALLPRPDRGHVP